MKKGPYFQPVQYISPLPEGYLQAASSIGQSYGRAIESIGDNISGAIKKYTKDKEESEILTGQAESITPLLQSFQGDIRDQKTQVSFDNLTKKLGDFAGQSLSQKRATLASAETFAKSFASVRQNETARLANERSAAELSYLKSKENDNKLLREAMSLNTDTDGNLDFSSALQTFSELGGNTANNDILTGLQNVQKINFGTEPKIKTLTGDSGQSTDVVQFGAGSGTIIPKEKSAPTPGPESNVGKMVVDRDRFFKAGDQASADAIQRQIDAETNKKPKLEASDQTFIQNIKEYQNQLKLLRSTIENYGTFESSTFGSPEASSALSQLPYKMAITYSKIVDPQSVAREGEVEAAKKYIVPLGLFANKKQALASIASQEKEINRRAEEFAKVKNLNLEDLIVKAPPPPAVAPVTVKAPSGLNYTVTRDPAKKSK